MTTASSADREPLASGDRLTTLKTVLDPTEQELLGGPRDRAAAEEATHLTRWAMILLRCMERGGYEGPEADPDHLRGVIRALDTDLLPRLQGIRDAAIRLHQQAGGSHGQLADAMGVPRSTAQTRAAALANTEPTPYELWARGLGPLP